MKLEIIDAKNLTWYNITSVDQDAVRYLKENFGFHELDIEDVLSKNQRSKIDEYENYIFLLLHFPVFNQYSERIEIEKINIFVGPNYIVTIHDDKLHTLKSLYEICNQDLSEQREQIMTHPGALLYEILNNLYKSCFPLIDKVGWDITEIERDLFEEGGTEEIRDRLKDIMEVKRNIMRFRRIIQPARIIIVALEGKKVKFITPKYEVYFDDIRDSVERIWEVLESYKEIIDTLHETNEALINHKTNYIIKILTAVSVTIMPLTFITGLYGMNLIHLPLSAHPFAFELLILGMLLLVLSMFWYFRKKRWL